MSLFDNIKIFWELSWEEKENLSLFCQQKYAEPWEVIFTEWDEANAMYILAEGEVEISHNVSGKKIILWSVKAEELLGEMALFGEQTTRMATAQAKKPSSLITILAFSIKELTLKHPDLLMKIKWIIDERQVNNKIIETSI